MFSPTAVITQVTKRELYANAKLNYVQHYSSIIVV